MPRKLGMTHQLGIARPRPSRVPSLPANGAVSFPAMKVTPVRTDPITAADRDLGAVLDRFLPDPPERSVVAVTSKIVAICEGRVVKIGDVDKAALVEQEADSFLPPEESRYGFTLTVRDGLLAAAAGIDESNGDGHYVLWPRDPQCAANKIREHLQRRFALREVGVIITDSTTRPLRRGVTGVALAHSGFAAIEDYVGRPDIFGHPLSITKANIRDGLAAAAVLVMGEADEQTPLAVIEDLPFVKFQDRDPTDEELAFLRISLEDDLYAPLLTRAPWRVGGQASRPRVGKDVN
jgi:putative folate metabolism gamma-glutamate ligase